MNSTEVRGTIPLIINVSSLRVLVFGTGVVARRKAKYFSDEAMEVSCLSKPDIPTSDTELSTLISSYDIIVAAVDDAKLNRKITGIAAQQKKWYNSATDIGNILIPAVFQEGDVTVAVSTNGKAPAVAAFIRTSIKSAYPALPQMVELQNKLRTQLKSLVPSQKRRAEILKTVLEDESVWKQLSTGTMSIESILQRYI